MDNKEIEKNYTVLFENGDTFIGKLGINKTVYEMLEKFEKLTNIKFSKIQFIFDFDAQDQSVFSKLNKKWVVSHNIYGKNLNID